MRHLVMVFSISLFLPAAAQQREAAARDSILFTSEAARAYAELRSVDTKDRSATLQAMPASMQSAVWAHHLLTVLAQNSELTAEQRDVVQEGLALLTPDLFAIDPEDANWSRLVHEPLARFTARVKKVFPPRVARELFAQLGPEVRRGSVVERYAVSRRTVVPVHRPQLPRAGALNASTPCECNVRSDYCDWSGFNYLVCWNAWCVYAAKGCGTFGQYPCEGLCRR